MGTEKDAQVRPSRPARLIRSSRRLASARFARNRLAVVGLGCLLALLTAAAFAGSLTAHDPTEIDLARVLEPPGNEHLLGTDHLGRDVLTRVLYGGRASLMIGFAAGLLAGIAGVTLGLVSGYFGRRVELPIMVAADLLLAFPTLLFALLLVAVLGPSLLTLIVALGIIDTPVFVRLVRSNVLSLKHSEFVLASKSIGAHDARLLGRHILPNTLGVVMVQVTFTVAGAITSAATLGFLGLGVPAPTPEWGGMLADAREYLTIAPHLMFVPGVVLAVVVLSLHLVGDALRDYLDPRMKQRRSPLSRRRAM